MLEIQYNQRKEHNQVKIKLIGRLDTMTAPQLETAFQQFQLDDINDIEFDIKNLEYISSAGLRVFITMQKNIQQKKGKMKLSHVNEAVMEIFEITGLVDIFRIER